MIRPEPASSGTSGSNALFSIKVRGKRNGVLIIDGLIFDKGATNDYVKPDSNNPKTGTPQGVETGRLVPPGCRHVSACFFKAI